MKAIKKANKNNSTVRTIKNLFFSFLVFMAVTIIVTDVLQSRIFFSFFVGFPTGLISGCIVFVLLNIKKNRSLF